MLPRIHRWVLEHRALSLLLASLALAGAGLLLRSRPQEQDIAMLLPGGPGSPREAARLLSAFGVLNTLLVDVEIPGGSRDAVAAAGAQVAEALRHSGLCTEVYSGPSLRDLLKLGEVLLPRRLYLYPHPGAELRQRLQPDALAESLRTLRLQLASPQAFVQKRQLLQDPLSLDPSLFQRFAELGGAVDAYQGQLLSRDGQHALLVVTPARPGLDAPASAALLAFVQRTQTTLAPGPAGPALLHAVGGPRFSAGSAGTLKRDIGLTLGTSVLGLMLLFLLRFRSLRLLAVAQIPLLMGMAGGLTTVLLVNGRINALTFAFGAVMLGVGIDYPIYLLNAASTSREQGLARLTWGLARSWRALLRGFGTTFLGFAVMMLSPLPGIRELALFGAAGIATTFAVTLTLLVPLSAWLGPAHWPGVPRWMERARSRPLSRTVAWASVLCIALLSLFALPRLRFDGELRHLDAQRPEVMAEYEQVMARFGLGGSGSLVVARAPSAEAALQLNDAVAVAVQPLLSRPVRSLSAFLPSRATQAARARQLATLDLTQSRAQLGQAADAAGFAPAAFDGFWQEVADVREGRTPPLTPQALDGTSLEPLVKRLLRCEAEGSGDGGCIAVTPLSLDSSGDGPDLARRVAQALPPGALLLDGDRLAQEVVARLPRELALLTGVGLLLNLAVLTWAYGSLRQAFFACVPCVLGLLGTLSVLSLAQVPLNLISSGALVLVLGCGVDYGIFVLQELDDGRAGAAVESTGVLLASLSTLGGFGTLVLATHPALHTLGAAVGLGVAISALAALFILPGLRSAR